MYSYRMIYLWRTIIFTKSNKRKSKSKTHIYKLNEDAFLHVFMCRQNRRVTQVEHGLRATWFYGRGGLYFNNFWSECSIMKKSGSCKDARPYALRCSPQSRKSRIKEKWRIKDMISQRHVCIHIHFQPHCNLTSCCSPHPALPIGKTIEKHFTVRFNLLGIMNKSFLCSMS